jgi:hypothetical protein
MDSLKGALQKLRGYLLETFDSLNTANLARREGTVLNRIDGMLKGTHRDAEIRLEHSPGSPYDRNLAVSISIITAEPLSSDVRFRINRMFSGEFPRSEVHFHAEFRKREE